MKTSEALRLVKERLATRADAGEHRMICIAAMDLAIPARTVRRITSRIARDLSPHRTYQSWLAQWYPDMCVAAMRSPQGVQPGRHAWLAALIAEYEARGD